MKLEREDLDDGCTLCVAPALAAKAGDVVSALNERKLSIVTAESCTAGLLAATLAQPHGAASVLQGGFVTYTKANKTIALGVPADLLQREGSVTVAVAQCLASGALQCSPADIAIAVTGVLGPEPDEDGNPVGLVYFCCRTRVGTEQAVRKDFGRQSHDRLQSLAVETALDLALQATRAFPPP